MLNALYMLHAVEGARAPVDGGGEPSHPWVQPAAAGPGAGEDGAEETAGGNHGGRAAAGEGDLVLIP